MLILSRRVEEVLCVGEDVRIKVIHVHRGSVRLAIEAPPSVRVDREEIRKLKEENTRNVRKSATNT